MTGRIKLFVSDLDGTLVRRDLRLGRRDREAVRRLRARGCAFAIATGRMIAAALPFASALGVQAPLIAYNGAWMRCLASGADWLHRPVPAASAGAVVTALEEAGLHVNLYLEDRVHVRALTAEARAYMAHARVEPVLCGSWAELGEAAPTKILAIGSAERIARVLTELRSRFAGQLWLTQSMPSFLEITHPEVNKGAALAHLAARLGLEASEIVAVGDGMNDREMLAYAGLGVAMANAPAALREAADFVTGSVEEDGVAGLIEHLVAEGRL